MKALMSADFLGMSLYEIHLIKKYSMIAEI